jgi:hypothetical protein
MAWRGILELEKCSKDYKTLKVNGLDAIGRGRLNAIGLKRIICDK